MAGAFIPFELEHYQSLYENNVRYNLADSSVKCLTTREWLSEAEQQELLDTGLFYPEVNGTHQLRSTIAALYPNNPSPDQILVTVGASQANSMVATTLLEAGDEVVVLSPGYRQIWGIAKNLGCTVKELRLDADNNWRLDLSQLDTLVTERTKLVAVVNPNNPTGTILSRAEMEAIVAACARVGAWLHADEVYCGTERDQAEETPSFWGMYDKLICTSSLSKAYGLSGLRIGWSISSPEMMQELWRRHEYAVIAAAAPSMTMANIALQPAKRAQLLERQKQISRTGWQVLQNWVGQQAGLFSVNHSPATSIAFVRFHLPLSSFDFAERIRQGVSVLVAPGVYLGAEEHLRITIGYEAEKVGAALELVGQVARKIASQL
jgi:aspartate/methionine/tyrosine aminotransferase